MRTRTAQVQARKAQVTTRTRRGGAPRELAAVADSDRTILEVVDCAGMHINEHELRYQLQRRKVDPVGLLERMLDLEQRGLIESTLCFRLTQQAADMLLDGRERPLFAGYRSDWS
jgi:predicted metal-dependent phosphoesterase TrpH